MKQFTFTSFDDPETRRGGWQIKDSSGLSPEELAAEEQLLTVGARLVSHEDTPPIVRAHERDALPTRLALTAVGDSAVRLSQERPAGTDGSGRPNNTFTHTVIANWRELAELVELPIRTLNSEAWLSPYGAKEVAVSRLDNVDFFPEFLEYDWADILASDRQIVAVVLDTLDATIQQRRQDPGLPRPLVVLRTEDVNKGVQWLEAIMSACLPVDAWNLHFSTYERNVNAHRAGQLSSAGYDIVISRDHEEQWSPHTLVVELDARNAAITHGQPAPADAMSWGRAVVDLLEGEIDPVAIVSRLSELENLQADYEPSPSHRVGWGAHLLLMEQRQQVGQDIGEVSTAMLADVAQEVPADTRVAKILEPVIPKAFNDPHANVNSLLQLVQNTVEEHTKASLLNGLVLRVLNDETELEELYPYAHLPTDVALPQINVAAILDQQHSVPSPLYSINALLLLQQLVTLENDDIKLLAQLWCGSLSPEVLPAYEHEIVVRLQRLQTLAPGVAEEFAEDVVQEFNGAQGLANAFTWHILHTLRSAHQLAGVADQLLLEGQWGEHAEAEALASSLLQDSKFIEEAVRNYVECGYAASESLQKILGRLGRNASLRAALSASVPHIRRLAEQFIAAERTDQWGTTTVDELSQYYLTEGQPKGLETVHRDLIDIVNFVPERAELATRRAFAKRFKQLAGLRATFSIAEGRCGEAVGHAWLIVTEFAIIALPEERRMILTPPLTSSAQNVRSDKAEYAALRVILSLEPKLQEHAWQDFLPGIIRAFEQAPHLAAYLWVKLQLAEDPKKHLKGDAFRGFVLENPDQDVNDSQLGPAEQMVIAVFDRAATKLWDKTARRELESAAKTIHKANERRLKTIAQETMKNQEAR